MLHIMSKTALKGTKSKCLTCSRGRAQFHSCLCSTLVWGASALVCHIDDAQKTTDIDGLLNDVSALITGLLGFVLGLAMLQNLHWWMVVDR